MDVSVLDSLLKYNIVNTAGGLGESELAPDEPEERDIGSKLRKVAPAKKKATVVITESDIPMY